MSQITIDPQTIYTYDHHKNIPWNIVQYQPVRQYLDPQHIKLQRQIQEGHKIEPVSITKKVCYIDQYTQLYKGNPPPCQYDFLSEFDQTLNKKLSRRYVIDQKLRKNSYLQQIQRKAKLYKSPAVGSYSLNQSASQRKVKTKSGKKIKHGQKRFFYQDEQFLSTVVPGSGCYYPHQDVPNIKRQRTTHKYWIDKHKIQNQKFKQRRLKEPDPGSYRAVSAQFNSFDKIKLDDERRRKKKAKDTPTHGFCSSDAKFEYNRQKKAKQQVKPDPCNYNTTIQWKGKGLDPTKNNWVRCVSAGPSRNRSVYH